MFTVVVPVVVAVQHPPADPAAGALGGVDAMILGGLLLIALATAALAHVFAQRRRRQPIAPVRDEWAARAAMEDLCASGWRAKITLYGWGAPVPDDAPPARRPLVLLEYVEYGAEHDVAVVRRLWAESIPAALDAMVQSARTDAALEEIERSVLAEQERWEGD
jgi:hypothetical protein